MKQILMLELALFLALVGLALVFSGGREHFAYSAAVFLVAFVLHLPILALKGPSFVLLEAPAGAVNHYAWAALVVALILGRLLSNAVLR